MSAPSRVWIATRGKELPDWVLERAVSGVVGPDGSFELEASDGLLRVEPGFAVFAFNDQVFACPPREVQEKIRASLGEPAPVAQQPRTAAPKADPVANRSDRPLKLKPQISVPPTPTFVLIEHVEVDDTYQRSIEGGASYKLIVKIAENWDWRLCLPLLISKRGETLYVIDGQHRLEAAKLRGDIRQLPAVVFAFDDPKAEAELFVAANRSRRPMSKLDDFHAAVVAGDKKALAVAAAVNEAGLRVGRIQAWQYWKPGEVVFVTAIERALHSAGKDVVSKALGMIAQAFEGLVLVGMAPVFTGLCTLIVERTKEARPIDPLLMQTVLRETGMPGWKEVTEGVETGYDRAAAMLDALAAAYDEAEAE